MRALIIFFLIFISAFPSYGADNEELKIGLIPEQNVFKQLERYKPVGEYIENKTGIKIKFVLLSRYGNIIDNFNRLHLDGAFWGSFTGALAIRKLGIEHIVRPVNPDGNSTYKGYIFVNKYSTITDVKGMRNRVIAFVDKATTAGYIFPVAYLHENGVDNIDTYFKEYFFTGSHDAAIDAVLDKKADIGCAKNTIYEMLARKNPDIKDKLKVIASSPEVPSNGLGLRKDLNPAIKSKLKAAFLGMSKDPDGKKVLEEFGALEFIETNINDYQPVFDLTEKAHINLNTYNYNNK
ncbi:MAG: phosphate/phosphite/phosphonate ABC transporter substrate-binding protein [Nitrospirae bacterium]|nr:phosphate/phosphite/phosphonate ABC transporter substrate-binding protein [Nitrospirota bacterium]